LSAFAIREPAEKCDFEAKYYYGRIILNKYEKGWLIDSLIRSWDFRHAEEITMEEYLEMLD